MTKPKVGVSVFGASREAGEIARWVAEALRQAGAVVEAPPDANRDGLAVRLDGRRLLVAVEERTSQALRQGDRGAARFVRAALVGFGALLLLGVELRLHLGLRAALLAAAVGCWAVWRSRGRASWAG